MHYSLPRKTDALLTKLLRLAGGDTHLVYAAIGSRQGASVPLGEVIKHIEANRPARPVATVTTSGH